MAVDVRPFAGAERVDVVLPAGDDADVHGLRDLLVRESAELEAELGAPVTFRTSGYPDRPAPGRRPVFYVGPAAQNGELRSWLAGRVAALSRPAVSRPYVELTSDVGVADAPDDADAVTSALSLLRTAVRSRVGNAPIRFEQRPASNPQEAVDRLVDEVGWTYPSFVLRGIDWPAIVDRWRPEAGRTDADMSVLQRWVAELRDPHTSVQPDDRRGVLPYTARVSNDAVRLEHVPRWSAAWAAGARTGDVVLTVGRSRDAAELLATTAGDARIRPWFAGRRAMTVVPASHHVVVEVRGRNGRELRWSEAADGMPWREPVSWARLSSGTGYLRVRGWLASAKWSEAVDAAFDELAGCRRLIVDVRGNQGGSLVAALEFRDRFLTEATTLGSVRFSVGDGTLSAATSITGRPGERRRWHRPVRFLLDRLSYSATEDALLGLRDLDHVQFYGEPSGGGSGRPRSVLLQEGVVLRVSTALTYENSGRCIEGRGLAVDVTLTPDLLRSGRAVHAADASW